VGSRFLVDPVTRPAPQTFLDTPKTNCHSQQTDPTVSSRLQHRRDNAALDAKIVNPLDPSSEGERLRGRSAPDLTRKKRGLSSRFSG
jgi:hypothetical protein